MVALDGFTPIAGVCAIQVGPVSGGHDRLHVIPQRHKLIAALPQFGNQRGKHPHRNGQFVEDEDVRGDALPLTLLDPLHDIVVLGLRRGEG